ncbi:hypothetical protein D3C87_1833440 [compost metagenome]
MVKPNCTNSNKKGQEVKRLSSLFRLFKILLLKKDCTMVCSCLEKEIFNEANNTINSAITPNTHKLPLSTGVPVW